MLARQITKRCPVSIPSEEVSFHPHSIGDDAGRLFWWNGELYRGITSEQSSFYEGLFRDGVIDDLVDRGSLIESELTDLTLDGYPMVVRHRSIPFVSYPNEWCATMLRQAALTILDLTMELAARGLTLKDAHPWNLLFSASKPVYVDLTSIAPLRNESTWSAFDEFRRFCYYPLVLMSHGQERIARSLLPEYEGVLRTELLTVMRGSGPSRFTMSKLLDRGLNSVRQLLGRRPESREAFVTHLARVRRDLEKIKLPSYEKERQTLNRTGSEPEPRSDWRNLRALKGILTELKPATVLDLSRGSALTSTMPAAMGINVVSIGREPSRATAIYGKAGDEGLPILPLIVDFVKPTPAIGYSNHYSIAATERLKCDMVIAFDFVHRVETDNHFNLDLIAEGLSSFSKKWLVVEYRGKEPADNRFGRRPVAQFVDALRKRFSNVRGVASAAGGDGLLLCEK